MAGVKGRSGRKRDETVLSVRELIDQAVTAAQWRRLWKKVAAAADKGDLRAMKFLTEYRYGQPQEGAAPAGPTVSATYYLPYREGDALPPGTVVEQEGAAGDGGVANGVIEGGGAMYGLSQSCESAFASGIATAQKVRLAISTSRNVILSRFLAKNR